MTKVSFPLWLVIIMNINVIIGAGVFVNPRPLTQLAGSLSFLSYFVVACIILPLVLVVAQLARMHKATEGGLYTYSKEGIGPWAGIVGVTSYFLGKVASSSILIKTIVFYLYSLIPILGGVSSIYVKIFVLISLICLNMLGLNFGGKLQMGFAVTKLIPIAVVILGGIAIFNSNNFTFQNVTFMGFSSSLPIALFAIMGFEICCSIGHTVKSAEKNMSRAVVISFLFVGIIYMLFQGMLFGGVGNELLDVHKPLGGFFIKLFGNIPILQAYFSPILSFIIMFSIIGSCYGIIFSNSWNVHIVAKEFNFKSFIRINNHGSPTYSVILQGFLIGILLLFDLTIVTLARLTILGVIINFLLIAVSLLRLYKTRREDIMLPWWVAFTSLLSCCYIAFVCLKDLL